MPPKPPTPDLNTVNLGAILDQPFLFQATNPSTVKVPSAQSFLVLSTLLPSGTAEGAAVYTFGPLQDLQREVQTTSGAVKTTDYLYSPADPAKIIAALEKKAAEQDAKCERLRLEPTAAPEASEAARVRLKTTKEKLAKARAPAKPAPPQLVRLQWIEVGDGELTVSGETVFHYEGADIVHSTSTITTSATPPRVDQLDTDYRYNDLGQVHEIDTAGSITKCEYDTFGRLAKKSGSFISPAGDFLADHRTVFLYSPPVGDPNQIPPPNALLSSINDSVSGAPPGFVETPEPMKKIPEPTPSSPGAPGVPDAAQEAGGEPKSWLDKLLGAATSSPSPLQSDTSAIATPELPAPGVAPPPLPLPEIPGSLDTTRVQCLYAYP